MSLLNNDLDVRTRIKEHLIANGIVKKWLSIKVNCSTTHLNEILECRRVLTDVLLEKINKALVTNFERNPSGSTSQMKAAG